MPRMLKLLFKTGQRPRLLFLYGLLLLALLPMPVLALTLKEKAEISSETICLADIIVEADAKSPWGEIVVWNSPKPGNKRLIYKSFVVSLLRTKGYSEEAASLKGPNSIEITRVLAKKSQDNNINTSKESQIDYEKLWISIEEQLSLRVMEFTPEGFIFDIIPEKKPEEVSWPEGTVSVLADFSGWRHAPAGRIALPLDVLLTNGQKRRLIIYVTIEYEGQLLIAQKDIKPKEKLDNNSISSQMCRITSNPNNYFVAFNELVRYQAKNYIRNGDVILQNQVELQPVLYKGNRTILTYSKGSLWLEVAVELLEDAIPGKKVRVRNLNSQKELLGFVNDDGSINLSN